MYPPSIIIPEFALIKIDLGPYVVHLLTNRKSQGHGLSIKHARIEEGRVESNLVLMESRDGVASMLTIYPQADGSGVEGAP